MAYGDAREGEWRGNWRIEWVTSTLHITSEHGVSNITIADAHTSAASSQLNWRPCRLKWARPFRWKTKSGFCACAITCQMRCTLLAGLGTSAAWVRLSLRLCLAPRYLRSGFGTWIYKSCSCSCVRRPTAGDWLCQ